MLSPGEGGGNHLRTTAIHLQCSNFDLIGPDRLAFAAEDEYSFYITDLQGNILHKFLPFQMAFQATQPKPLIRDAATVYALRFMDDTIYRITSGRMEPAIVIDYGGHALSRKAFLDIPVTGMDRLIDKSYMTGNGFFSINSTHAFFWMSYNGKGYLNIFNIKTGRLTCNNVQSIRNDLFSGAGRVKSFSNTWHDLFIGTILPSELGSGIPLKFNEKENTFSVDDNPLIFVFSLKI